MLKLVILGVLSFQCCGTGAFRSLNSAANGQHVSLGTAPSSGEEDRLPPRGSCLNPNHVRYLERHEQKFNATLQRVFWGYENVVEDEVQRYQVLKIAGAGREGAVAIALDLKTLELVAIKKVLNIFRDTHLTQMVRNEIKVMDLLKKSPDVMTLRRIAQPYDWKTFASVFMIIEMMELEMPRGTRVFQSVGIEPYIDGERMRRNVFQVLRGLHYLHTAGLVYNDMRYHNIMLDKHCNTRIIDLGMVKPAKDTFSMNGHLPLPAAGDQTESPRDIWMLGVSILVWLGGKRFNMAVSKSHLADKAEKIVKIAGLPKSRILSRYSTVAQGHLLAAHATQTSPVSLQEQLPHVDPSLLGVVRKMVSLHTYAHRLSARELLDSPYFEGLEEELGPVKDGPPHSAASLQHFPAASAEEARRLIADVMRTAGVEP